MRCVAHLLFNTYSFNSSDAKSRVPKARASEAVDAGLIPSRVERVPSKLVLTRAGQPVVDCTSRTAQFEVAKCY